MSSLKSPGLRLDLAELRAAFSKPALLSVAQKAWCAVRLAAGNFIANNDLLWASALTYTVILSIIPMLALAFSVLTELGGADRLREMLTTYLALGSPDVVNYIMHFVRNINSATLGSVGGVALLLTVLSTLGTIELAFNTIWQVPSGRSYLRKFADYLSVVFTVPLILVAALAVTAHATTNLHRVPGMALLVPFLILWLGFFFLFVFFPYTNVKWSAAAIGALISALLFQFAQFGYIHFQIGVSSYRAVYGALAAVPIVLVWIYVGWSIVLFGVEICFALQSGRTRAPELVHSPSFMRYVVLLVMLRLTERIYGHHPSITPEGLAAELGISQTALGPIIQRLKEAKLVLESEASPDAKTPVGLFLARAPDHVRLGEVLHAVDADGHSAQKGDPRIASVLARLAHLEIEQLNAWTLADLGRDAGQADQP
jgi:membrane protein